VAGCTQIYARIKAGEFYERVRGSAHMKKLMIALALAFAVIGGAVAVFTVSST
jgi:hypothetical protein